MKNIWQIVFFACAALHLLGIIANVDLLIMATKPLLMPSLMLWLWQVGKGVSPKLRNAWLIGLTFSTLGDILLMGSGSLFFLLGLSAFLLTHISYISGTTQGFAGSGFLKRHPGWALPFVLTPVLMLSWLWVGIPSGMRIPVTIYALVINTMVASVVNLKGRLSSPVFISMATGALLFMLSDSLIAINKFGHPFEGERLAVMVTYIVGQWLLTRSVIRSAV